MVIDLNGKHIYTREARIQHSEVSHIFEYFSGSPRPLYQRRQTFSSALHTQALLSFTALANPEPGTNGFVWHKQHSSTWIPLLSNADLRISTSSLQTNLTITNVSKSDFGHYKVTVTNEIGKYEQHLYLTENGRSMFLYYRYCNKFYIDLEQLCRRLFKIIFQTKKLKPN
jgi:hypothetical protein